MTNRTIIVKIGGKIIENNENLKSTLEQFKNLIYKKKVIDKVIIIPGGGSYANTIRNLDNKLNIGDDLSHWMAIFAMNCNGMNICQNYEEINCINDINKLKKNKDSILIFLPLYFLYQKDKLPHSWNVTSDSITIFIAKHLGLKECFLIKDIDGIFIKNQNKPIRIISIKEYEDLRNHNNLRKFKTPMDELKQSTPIDLYSLKLIKEFKISCIILNGISGSKRVFNYFNENDSSNKKIYTKIIQKI